MSLGFVPATKKFETTCGQVAFSTTVPSSSSSVPVEHTKVVVHESVSCTARKHIHFKKMTVKVKVNNRFLRWLLKLK